VAVALTLLLTSFIFVFLKAGQQLNVARGHYYLVPWFSFGMAAAEVFVIATIATQGYDWMAVVGMGIGGSTGAMLAMYLHTRILGNKHDKTETTGSVQTDVPDGSTTLRTYGR
jgi:hypothetical protein